MKHILVVEDETHLAIGIKYNLEAEGYDVSTVGDGASAIKIVEEDPRGVDLVILDLMLPGMSGYAVCEHLRASGNTVPVLMLSARTLVEDRIRGYDVGANQYLQKPFDLEELLSMVRNLLTYTVPTNTATSDSKNFGPKFSFDGGRVEIDFNTFDVTVSGKPLRLTSTEMKLLHYFIDHEGKVVTRNTLLEEVWGLSHSPTTRTVDNFIVNLRKYFEINPARPRHFLSMRGTGYRFVAEPGDSPEPADPTDEPPEAAE